MTAYELIQKLATCHSYDKVRFSFSRTFDDYEVNVGGETMYAEVDIDHEAECYNVRYGENEVCIDLE